jgi:hypothetical protein
MNDRVTAVARRSATCRQQLREQLGLSLDSITELGHLSAIIGAGQLTLADLQELIAAPGTSLVLSSLAPREFGAIRARLESGSRSALEITPADLQTELAETVAIANAVITATARDITANVRAE